MESNLLKGVALALLSALGFSVMPIFAMQAYHAGVSTSTLLLLRFSISSVILSIYCLTVRPNFNLSKLNFAAFFILGFVLYTAQAILHFSSIHYLSPSIAILLLYTFPVFVFLLSVFLKKEPFPIRSLFWIVCSFIGLYLLISVQKANLSTLGITLALSAAVVYAAYTVLGNIVVQKAEPLLTVTLVSVFACLGVLLVGWYRNDLNFHFDTSAWYPIAGIICISTILADFTFFSALKYIGSVKVASMGMLEPRIGMLVILISGIFIIKKKA